MICAYLKNATEQEVFDKVATHLLTQMERAVIGKKGVSACQYRAGELSCAAGCLIPDEEYDKNFLENKDWGYLIAAGVVPDMHADLVIPLQHIHDRNEPQFWKQKLEALAWNRGLDFGDALQQLPITKE